MEANTAKPRVITNYKGTELHAKGWIQEAALRMLMNNFDPEVAERPRGFSCLWRNWQSGS